MCRACAQGGRRCPSNSPEARAAYRKAHRAAQGLEPIGPGGATLTLPAQAPPDLREQWQPDRIRALSDDINETLRGLGREPGMSEEERLAIRDRHFAVHDRVEEMGGPEGAIRIVGDAVASEAERRAGVTGEQVRQMCQDYVADQERQRQENQAEIERIIAEAAETPDGQRWRKAQAAYEAQKNAPRPWNEEQRAVFQEYIDANTAYNELDAPAQARALVEEDRQFANRIANAMPDEARDALARLSDSYQEVLRETREFGGVTPTWNSRTSKAAATAFNEVADNFPRDWIEAHNDGPSVYARVSKTRAHYTSRTSVEERGKVRSGRVLLAPSREPEDSAYYSYREATETEREAAGAIDGEPCYTREEWDVRENWSGEPIDPSRPPRGRGWEVYTNPETGRSNWRRPKFTMRLIASESMPEITTNAQGATNRKGSPTASTASHEMSHRFEDRIPDIGRVEADFIRRRTTGEDGERENLKALYGGRKHKGRTEVSRPDGFVDAYMGKEYDGYRHHEVLSMGTEAVFYGETGGLVGAGRYSADPDMRSFVLGVFATVGRKND